MSTTSETELRAEIAWLEARNREVNRQRIEAETVARSQAIRLSELERENARMREALQLIANATHPRFLAEHDIHLLHVSEKTFGDCINIARAALAGSGEK